MDDNQIIRFAWGGCGNLVNSILKSSQYYDTILSFYSQIDYAKTWTENEWALRNQIGKNLSHDLRTDGILLAWDNSLDTCFHYFIKNNTLNHLGDVPILTKFKGLTVIIPQQERFFRNNNHWPVTQLLKDFELLFAYCHQANPNLNKNQVRNIFDAWILATRCYYTMHLAQALEYFSLIGIDYRPTNLYTILYENTNTR